MYTLLQLARIISAVIVISAIVVYFANYWQKRNDKENANYSKEYNKMLIKFGLCALGMFVVSNIFLWLRMY